MVGDGGFLVNARELRRRHAVRIHQCEDEGRGVGVSVPAEPSAAGAADQRECRALAVAQAVKGIGAEAVPAAPVEELEGLPRSEPILQLGKLKIVGDGRAILWSLRLKRTPPT